MGSSRLDSPRQSLRKQKHTIAFDGKVEKFKGFGWSSVTPGFLYTQDYVAVARPIPSMYPKFDSQTQRRMWIGFVVGSLLCSERFLQLFPFSSRTNISKFQCRPGMHGHLWTSSCKLGVPRVNKFHTYITYNKFHTYIFTLAFRRRNRDRKNFEVRQTAPYQSRSRENHWNDRIHSKSLQGKGEKAWGQRVTIPNESRSSIRSGKKK